MNLENSYITEEDLYFKNCFTETEDGINIECNNINVNCLTSKDNKFSLDKDGNLSVNKVVTTEPINTEVNYSELFNLIYPVGSIYISTSSVNPTTLFGGVWEEWGKGRTIFGFDETQGEFNSIEKTGGIKSHNHTSPGHSHNINDCVALINTYYNSIEILGKTYYWNSGERVNGSSRNDASRSMNWAVQTRGETSNTTPGNTGESSSIPPYITCYMWKRLS